MRDLRSKLKRQIEIVGLCLSPTGCASIGDLAEMFKCEELTIKRDLQELRSYGVNVHSVARKGIHLYTPLQHQKIEELIIHYAALSTPSTAVDKATGTLVRKQKETALMNIVLLQQCIEQGRLALVDYEKTAGTIEKGKELLPGRLFQADGQWRLIARNDDMLKQFLLTKMMNVQATGRKLRRIPEEQIDALFSHSFRSFLGTDRIKVRIQLSKKWANLMKPRQYFERAEVVEKRDGTMELDMTVNNLEVIAGWVVSRGNGVTVIEPEKLRLMVINLAKGTLGNYMEKETRSKNNPGKTTSRRDKTNAS